MMESPTLLHELFEAQADRTPDRPAVAWENERLTYGELDERANRLAAHLRALGVRPEARVGVCVERSAELIVALLATLKAGGAYIPLDPAYPVQRNAYMLADSRAEVVLAQRSVLAALPPLAGRLAVLLDEALDEAAEISGHPAGRLERLSDPRNLAYFIYTSGSTGRPKGIAIEHRSVVSLMRWCAAKFSPADLAGVLASTSICFDISIFEIFAPLCAGGTVIVAGNALDLPYLPSDPPVTLISTVPSAMAELVRTRRVPASVRIANLGGETLPGSLVEEIHRTTAIDRVYNVYGPSEDTTYSTCALIPRGSRTPPVGEPLPGTRIWLLDAEGMPVPFTAEGEVYLSGDGLSRGYFGRPELTAERFLPDPFSGEPGGRMYRVGDLGRFLPDGQLHYVGRIDFQVKIRGFRVELGEVEDALMRHPAVREAAVMAHGEVAAGKYLVAYLAVDGMLQEMPEVAELRSFLGATLPHYMVPSQFVRLDALPRTLNGKVDRRALPDPGAPATVAADLPSRAAGEPARELLEQVARIWAAVLELPSVGRHDNFFDLGGHSLLGARALGRIRDLVGVDLPLRSLFRAPTVEGLAGAVADALSRGQTTALAAAGPAPSRDRLPLSFAQERFWLLDRLEHGSAVYDIPLMLALEGEPGAAALEGALREIARRHDALRARFVEVAGEPFQEIASEAGLDLPRIDLADLPADRRRAELDRLIREESAAPFDLARGPLLRARLVRLGTAEHALLLNFHHIVFDGWSRGVFNRELSALYAAALTGEASPLPAPPVRYAGYVLWQRRRLTGEALAELLAWWSRELAGAPAVLTLPTDRPRPAVQSSRGATERLEFPPALVAGVDALARNQEATRFMVLLAAFQALLGALSGQEDLLVGAPSANRPRPDLEEVVGLFVETLVLRGRLAGDPAFRELLARVRETALEAYAHQDLPFDRLVAGLRVERSAARNPLVQVLFALQEAETKGLALSGLAVRLLDPGSATSKFDLSLFMEETDRGLRASLEYAADLFDRSTAQRLLARFATLLEAAVADPGRRLSEILPLAPEERLQAVAGVERVGTPVVPARAVVEPALPGLPAPGSPPSWEVEQVAGIWAEVLAVPAVGPDDNFFHLGGHSLLGARMLARIRERFGVDLPLRELFRTPTVSGLAGRVFAAREDHRLPPVRPLPRGGLLPVSLVQESLWFIHRLDPASHVYNVPLAWRLSGPLDGPALAAALTALAGRHEVLRAAFVEVEGSPFVEIAPPAPVPLPRLDLSGLPPEALEAELARIVRAEAGAAFDLRSGPLLRARLAVLGAGEHALLLTLHHAVFDGWSQGILTRELAALYAAGVAGRPPLLPALPVQYADFVAWQRSWLEEGALECLLAWWRGELRGAPTALELPTDRPRPPLQTFRGGWEHLVVPAATARAVLALGRREGATAFMTVLAAFQLMLHRLTGQDDLLVGSPVANRLRPEFEPLIGYFVDTTVLRGRFQGAETFPQRLARTREAALNAFSHQEIPFGALAALQAERDPSRNPLFQVLFSLDMPAEPLALPGVSARPLPTGEPAAKFDLSLGALEADGALRLQLEHNLDLFDHGTARRFLERFAALLESLAADPGRRLDTVPLLSAAELGELLAEAERTAGRIPAPVPVPKRLHDLFAAQAARAPEALAVLSPAGERWSYAELDRRSDRLARSLARRGVGPEVPVGVCLERSPELVAALLGVLKAGGVYLPLDPAYPPERLAFMLEDSGAAIALTRRELAGRLPAGAWKVVAVDEADEAAESGPVPADLAFPESLAYLIYTSGSTGRPKGVGVSHAAAAAHIDVAAGLFGLRAGERMLWFSSPSFDVSMEEVLAPLARGAAVVLREADLWSPAEFLDQAAALGVSVVDLPTAYWHQWAADCERAQPPADLAVRLVILGGEAMSVESARRWLRSPLAGLSLLNGYGPTEGVVTATAVVVDAAAAAGGTVPIGRALPGRSAWVLDRAGQPVPGGVAGELCLGGPLLARGYLGRPDVTAERFVPDPFAGEPGARLYRTGDLARRRPDGVLEFLGRADRQLKVRGFRVEPGEIESALARHPAVREVAVDARPDAGGGQRLMAWIVPAGAAPAADLAGFLNGTLPDHMVPSAFVTVAGLPLTPNGKVDLRALPDPELPAGDLAALVLPRTPVEKRLAVLWQELLGLPRVGIRDSFFALGGHSLLATRLLSRMRDAFGVEIPVRALFSAPTIERLAALVEGTLPRAAAPILLLPAAGEPSRPERPPLSFSQQGLWLIERLQPAGGAYNLATAVRFDGPLDVAALAAALGGVVQRHEALRTRFAEADGGPWQEVLPASAAVPALPLIDLSGLPAERHEEESLRLVRAESDRPFDLAAGPLLRARLVRLDPAGHLLQLTLHHAVSDGWSENVLMEDLGALYAAAVAGRPAELPPLPLQLADYAVWQREHLRGEVLAELLAAWRQRLAGVPPLELPTDRRRPAVWTFRGASRRALLKVTAADLEPLVRDQDATSFMVLLATFQVLLGRYAGQEDFAVGTPSASRTRSELEGVIGFFVHMLPLRADLSGAPTFRDLLARVRATVLEAFAHQGLPFELLVEDLAPERDLGRNPIFQAVLQLLYAEELAFPGLTTRRLDLENGSAKFDLNFVIEQKDGRFNLFCEYPVDLFEATTIQRLLDHFEVLLGGAVAAPDRAIGHLPLLSAAERHHLVLEHNDIARDYPREATIHQLVEEAAARYPEAVAVVFGDRQLTYRQLDALADRWAARLLSLGVGPEDRVALLVERSLEMMVALLAILKAGAAYAPLDPALPAERLAYLIEDLRPPVVLAQEHLRPRLPGALSVSPHVVSLAEDPGDLSGDWPFRRPAVTADRLAYVLYTSGSTGRPKGVACTHRGVVRLVKGETGYADLGPQRTLLQLTALTFDPSVMELWGPLANGGRLVVFPPGVPTFEALEEIIARHGVDTVWLTTGLFHQVVDERPEALAPVRQLLAGGDVLSPAHVRRAIEIPPGRLLVNGYGPTESTLFTTCQAMTSAAEVGEPVSIGRPVNGTRVHVLDRELQPVPFGVPGELYIGGDGLARCYAGRPDLTAERFVPSPLPGPPGERLYRTGDLVRPRVSGELEFLGRLDFQVKVRGFRIELGEIEAALGEHPGVRQCAAVVRQDARGEKRLVAFAAAAAATSAEELRAFLAARLPAYMVPSSFVLLPALPLTSHGKVDRRALPAPDDGEGRDFTAPRNPTETLLAALWSEILGVERIGVHDNFFAVGGHSLRAVQLASRLRRAFGVELEVQALFAAPTLADLAAAVERARGEGGLRALPPILPVPRGGLLPVSFPQQRLWFVERLAPDHATYNLPLAFRLRGRLYAAALAAALGEVVRRHETLRARFVERDGQPWQEILPPAPVVLPLVDLGGLPAAARERELVRIGREDAGRPFDLAAGLMRAALVRLDRGEHAFLVTLHHIAFDGWSEEVLRRELSALYAAALTGKPAALPELRIQYADFAAWQRSWPAEVLAGQLAYWTGRLDGVATLEIPTDRPRPPVQTFRGGVEPLAVPPAVGNALRALTEEHGVTLFMLMLAGWQTLLHRLSGQADVAVGSPVANRTRSEIEGLIGFFINMLAFRTDFSGDPGFAELLGRVRQVALEAYDHVDVPFERLVDELRLERDLSRNPVVQVMFTLQNAGTAELRLAGLAVEPLDLAGAVAKFDLTLSLLDEADGGFGGWIEYNSDLFDRVTVARLAGHLGSVLAAVAAAPLAPVSRIDLLTTPERQQVLREWNDTRTGFPESVLIHQFFEAQADRAPGALAAVWQDRAITYGGLEERANRLARLLRRRGIERGMPVGVWMERSLDMLAAVLGVLKAGGYYLPLDPAWPAERVEGILGICDAPAVLTRSPHLGPVLEMQWRLPLLTEVVCLDVETPAPPPEPVDAESVRALFDLVAERAVDRVTAGGFVSSFTGEPFSAAEVDEYRDRVLSLIGPWLRPQARVLEIGSGSGLLLWEIAPRVARSVGLDPSALTQERNRARAAELGLGNVELPVGFAHEIETWPGGGFDLVILASTAQFFPGPLYLERIVSQALRLLAPGGALLIADVPDARRQEELRRTVEEQRARRGLPPRQDPHKILSLDEDLFRDLAALPGAGEVAVHYRGQGFDNELRFRYDVVVTRGDHGERPRRKRLWTSWHVAEQPADRLPAVAAPEDLAYIIHTSGSTGQPKGIAVQHRPVANLFAWLNPAFGIGPEDRVLFATSLCFDLSVYDIFGLLAAGGCVHVASEEELRDAEQLVRLLLTAPVTLWDSAPAALVRLAPLFPAEPAVHSRLRRVMLSGDWIPVTLPDRVRTAFPHAAVTSLGGATEATVWSNFYPIGAVDPSWPSIPYGRPIDNAHYHVLDAGLIPCPVGVPGDLYIGGEVLCVGYAHQPAVTAAAFRPDPFSGVPGARIYRTGDRARYFTDGNLEFLGRIDQQVKIRGFRIELGEIEVALARHPELREAVVLAREDVPGDKRLVAYVVPAAGAATPSGGDLREFLRRSLPDYMIPAAFVALDHLPVTANGKLDRRALPAPRFDHAAEEGEDLPLTATEQTLAGLWREILGVEGVGRSDDFFDLGGHSLLATQLVARLREVFGAEVPLRVVFQAPMLSDLADEIELTLAELAGEGAAPAPAAPAIQPVPRVGELPLSASQLRQWFLVQLEPESAAYNLPVTLKLEGVLRREILAAALDEIVRRHEALRTTFGAAAGRPFAVVQPRLEIPLPLADLAALPAMRREAEARRLANADLDRPFDLTAGPLLRATLIRLAPCEHVLAVTFHHIVFDGSSLGVFLRELAALYEAVAGGRPSPLPALPIQYVDYAAWQRGWMESPEHAGQLAHWKERLADASRVLDLPADRPRPAVQSHRGLLMQLATPPGLEAGLKSLTGREGVTLFMAVLAGYATVLGRYTGQDDLNVGTYVANRRHEVLERLIGFFVNTLVLRADLTGDPTFRGLLARTREMTLDAFERQELPFEELLEELEIGRDLSRTPLFQVMFGVQNFAVPSLQLPGLSVETIGLTDTDRTTTDLSYYLWEEAGQLTSWAQFSTDLFDVSTIERLFGHVATLLAAAAADPDRRLSELPLLPAGEREQILRDWSAGGAHREAVRLVHERLREQARRNPDAPAVLAGGEVLTYGELDRRAGRVARGLRRLGVGAETVVGLCIDRTPEMIVALYGILGAGAAYLPLDPTLPADRLVLLAGDAGVPVVLTRRGLASALPELPARLLRVDADFEADGGEGPPAVLAPIPPESAAYVLYTSGSTGAPKGVVVEHRALAAFVAAALETYGIGPADRVLQFANLAFDTSVEEIYPCLAAGGTLVLRDEEMLASPARFLAACRDAGVTVLDLPTAWWHELSAGVEKEGAVALPADLRLIILGGERALPERVRGWLAATGARPRLFNSYGPTEGTVVATACDLGATAPAVPIGRPLPGVEVHLLDTGLLDAGLRLVPAGVPGEICLGGAGLARGYLGRPDLTAERFVPSPFGPAGARLYRTGDRGRWRRNGQLDFAGRVDDQVKVRGFRIEPGEVAAALARHPAIQEAVVAAHEVRPGELELTGYAVPAREPWPEIADLRAFLKDHLPAYMVPAGLVLLAALPRTATGKIDRRALPAPDRAARRGREYAAPETSTEELLAGIWQQLLGVEPVGIYDNFFDLGGHSLLAPQVFARIEETFQIELPLRVLFEAPTVAQMANAVEQILLAQIEELSEEEVADLVGGDY